MADRFTVQHVRERTYKPRDAWWTVLLVDPVASRLVVPTANRTSITPNQITLAGFVLGVAAARFFGLGGSWPLVAGAACFYLSFLLDCMDGKVARLKGTGTVLGGWLDYILDRFRVLICAVGLFGGQYADSGDARWLWLALAVVFLDMLRYMNAMQSTNGYTAMRQQVVAACDAAGVDADEYLARLRALAPVEDTDNAAAGPARDDPTAPVLHATATKRFGWFTSIRRQLARRRIRPHLFSGIEFQMFVFIVGPVVASFSGSAALLVVTVASAALLVAFELSVVYMTVLSARDVQALSRTISASRKAASG